MIRMGKLFLPTSSLFRPSFVSRGRSRLSSTSQWCNVTSRRMLSTGNTFWVSWWRGNLLRQAASAKEHSEPPKFWHTIILKHIRSIQEWCLGCHGEYKCPIEYLINDSYRDESSPGDAPALVFKRPFWRRPYCDQG